MPCKVVYFFNMANAGWTETYYSNQSFASINLNSGAYLTFLQNRFNCLAAPAVIFGARVSSLQSPKQTYVYRWGSTYQAGLGNPAGGFANPDIKAADILLRMYGTTGYARFLWLRGIPDNYIQFDQFGSFTVPAAANKNIVSLMNSLSQTGYGIRHTQTASALGVTPLAVQSVGVSVLNANWSSLAFAGAYNPGVGGATIARFTGVPRDDLPGFPKQVTPISFTNAAPFTMTIPYRLRAQGTVAPNKMAVIPYGFVIDGFPPSQFDWEYWDFTEHKTGRPFGSARGRSRAAVRAQ
jgi:hypothetical protein